MTVEKWNGDGRDVDEVVFAEPVKVKRRPVLPAALPVVQATVVGVRETSVRAGHAAAFHAARTPVYGARLVGRSPVGAWRAVGWLIRWVLDVEGRRVRAGMAGAENGGVGEASAYLRIDQQHREAMKLRSLAVLAGAAVSVVLLATVAYVWGRLGLILLAVAAVLTLGVLGRNEKTLRVGASVHEVGPPRLTSALIVDALRTLGIGELNKALKDDPHAVRFVSPVCRDGAGWRADLDLPGGVTASDVIERRSRLASGLRRPESAVWPAPGDQHAGRLTIFVSDKAMDGHRPVRWPLLERGRTSYFEPLVVGADERGRPVSLTLAGASCIAGGVPRSGKTVGVRVLALAAALDPLVELHLIDGKGGSDWLPFEPIATFLCAEDDDEGLARCMADLRAVQADMRRRYKTLRSLPREQCPQGKVTADLAARRPLRLAPILYVIDESQILLNGPEGKDAAAIVEDLIRRGPAAGITLVLATQRPSRDSIPTGASANASLRVGFRTMDHTSSDIILGSGVGTAGYRSNGFTRSDVGLSWVLADGNDPTLCRWAYVDADDAAAVIARARADREKLGLLPTDDDEPAPDLLADVLAVWPAEDRARLWYEDLSERLVSRGHTLTSEAVSAALRAHGVSGVQVTKTVDGTKQNRRGVARQDVSDAQAARVAASTDATHPTGT